jgi:YesN/AraC family two-component response regulator
MLMIRDPGWAMTFTSDPVEALELIRTEKLDVIVTDMRMPMISGVQLLTEAYARQPQTVRIVLSGFAEEAAVLASLAMTHQFLSKPISADELIQVVDRACELQDMLNSEELCQVAGRVGSLPARPTIYAALTQELSNPIMSLASVGSLVEQDIAITAKLLQVVNSAFIGIPQKTTSVLRAVSYIGTSMLKNLVLSLEVFQSMG